METTNSDAQYVEPVLKRLAHTYTGLGLAIAVVLHFAFVGAYWTSEYFNRGHEEVMKIPYGPNGPIVLGNPPTITNPPSITTVIVSGTKPDKGIPVPVPDPLVLIDKTIPTQGDYDRDDSAVTGSVGANGAAPFGVLKVSPSDAAPPDTFIPVEQFPQVVKSVTPEYPQLAQRIGIEGRVMVKLWVDKDGKPHQASVLKSDAEILNQSAIDAAMTTRFTPAIMNKGPVSVWVVIPYTFRLKQGQ